RPLVRDAQELEIGIRAKPQVGLGRRGMRSEGLRRVVRTRLLQLEIELLWQVERTRVVSLADHPAPLTRQQRALDHRERSAVRDPCRLGRALEQRGEIVRGLFAVSKIAL